MPPGSRLTSHEISDGVLGRPPFRAERGGARRARGAAQQNRSWLARPARTRAARRKRPAKRTSWPWQDAAAAEMQPLGRPRPIAAPSRRRSDARLPTATTRAGPLRWANGKPPPPQQSTTTSTSHTLAQTILRARKADPAADRTASSRFTPRQFVRRRGAMPRPGIARRGVLRRVTARGASRSRPSGRGTARRSIHTWPGSPGRQAGVERCHLASPNEKSNAKRLPTPKKGAPAKRKRRRPKKSTGAESYRGWGGICPALDRARNRRLRRRPSPNWRRSRST